MFLKSFFEMIGLQVARLFSFFMTVLVFYIFLKFNLCVSSNVAFLSLNIHLCGKVGLSSGLIFLVGGFSLAMILLVALMISLCFVWSWFEIYKYEHEVFLIMTLMMMMLMFMMYDFFLFMLLFETSLMPLYFLMLKSNGRSSSVRAGYYLYIYTGLSGICLILAYILLVNEFGFADFSMVIYIENLFFYEMECLLWVLLFVSFAMKVPMFPFHIWLPEAHVESPTIGSVILAAIMLKLGLYGMFTFVKPFLFFNTYFLNMLEIMCCYSVLISLLFAAMTVDMKKMAAYLSISHMSVVLLSLMMKSAVACFGGLLMIFAHGFMSGGLFFLIGAMYDSYKIKSVLYLSGLVVFMPKFSFIYFLYLLFNMGVPPALNFVAEMYMFMGIFDKEPLSATVILMLTIFNVLIFYKFFSMMNFGTFKTSYYKNMSSDMVPSEFNVVCLLLLLTVACGLFSKNLIFIVVF